MLKFRISSENTGSKACGKRASLQGDGDVPHENDALEPRNNGAKKRGSGLGTRTDDLGAGDQLCNRVGNHRVRGLKYGTSGAETV